MLEKPTLDSAAALDVDGVRSRFPALTGYPERVYADGPGGSQVPEPVIEAIAGYLRAGTANAGGVFATSRQTVALLEHAREVAAAFTGSSPAEIAFGPNMTTLNFLLAHTVARTLAPGDEIVVTALDHDANVTPWRLVAQDHGLEVREVPLRRADLTLDYDALEAILGARTRVVALCLASNAVGTIPDLERVVAAARSVGALVWADAVHYAPHRRLRRAEDGIDVLLCSPYKYFGPHLGIAAIRRDLAESWPADVLEAASPVPPGHRFEAGTPSFEALAGFVAAVDYIGGLGEGSTLPGRLDDAFNRIHAHEDALSARFLEGVRAVDGVAVHGIADVERVHERTPTFCFSVDGYDASEVADRLAREDIFIWYGDYYALGIKDALALGDAGGTARAGFLHYNTADEVDRVLDALRDL